MLTCFVIMPITTPDHLVEQYDGDTDHFIHTLECLFIPAIEKAGYKPLKPISEGSEVIHARIIENLESADMVLCDISIINPNVFFELGIRTALNKPVAMIKDDHTKRIPFDNALINCLTYDSSLKGWNIQKQIDSLSDHIEKSSNNQNKENALWKHLGISKSEKPLDFDGRLQKFSSQIEALEAELKASKTANQANQLDIYKRKYPELFINAQTRQSCLHLYIREALRKNHKDTFSSQTKNGEAELSKPSDPLNALEKKHRQALSRAKRIRKKTSVNPE